jgi:hypothetical protein
MTPEARMRLELEETSCAIQHDALRTEIAGELKTMNATLNAFVGAFPHTDDNTPDFGGHRSYHESLIKAARAEEAFWIDLRRDLIKRGVVWGITIAIGLMAIGLQVKLGIIKIG